MAHIPIPNSARVGLTFTHNVDPIRCEWTFGLTDPSGAMFTNPGVTCNSIYLAATSSIMAALPLEVILDGVVWEDVRTVPYGGADFPQTPFVGTRVMNGQSLPTDVSIAVRKNTNQLGRSGRGRMYMPIWNNAILVGANQIAAAYATELTTALTTFQGLVEAGLTPATLTLLSTQNGGSPRPIGVSNRVIEWALTDLVIDNQRRRLPGRGR